MSVTLGDAINAGLVEIGEPEITSFTATNLLQRALINEANYAVRDIMSRSRFRWAYHRDTLTTTAVVKSYATVTNGSTSVTNTDSDGNAEDATVAVGAYFRLSTDYTSYLITAVSGSTITLETAYVGDSATATAYYGITDEYSLPASDVGDVAIAQYGEGGLWANSHRRRVEIVPLQALSANAGGDFHLDSSGKPVQMSRIRPDSSDLQVFKLWPYPDDEYVIELWYTKRFTSASDIDTTIFGGDAPQLAEDCVCFRCAARAFRWAGQRSEDAERMQQYERGLMKLVAGPTTLEKSSIGLATYRRSYSAGIRSESQIAFDRQ